MSSIIVVGIAVVGKSNEPLYLFDCEKEWSDLQYDTTATNSSSATASNDDNNNNINQSNESENKNTNDDDEDPFGFIEFNVQKLEQRNSMSLSCQILIHAALDNLEEQIERPSGKNGQMPIIVRKNTATSTAATTSSSSKDPLHWLGLLLVDSTSSDDGYTVYGYITATNIKLMAITKDIPSSSAITRTMNHDKSNTIVSALQILLHDVHQHYISYLLNPFCDTRGGSIRSKVFDCNILTSIRKIRNLLQ